MFISMFDFFIHFTPEGQDQAIFSGVNFFDPGIKLDFLSL